MDNGPLVSDAERMVERGSARTVVRWLAAIGRVLIRALTIFLAVLKPAEQMNAQTTTPPDVPRPRPKDYRP